MVIIETDQEQNIISVWYLCNIMQGSGYLNITNIFNNWLTYLVNKNFLYKTKITLVKK